MKGLVTLVLASQFLGVAALAQTIAPPGPTAGSLATATVPVNEIPQSSVIRILTPVANQTAANGNAVDVRFELVSPASNAGNPNFLIQLDGSEPIRTSSMQQTLTGVKSGPHNLSVELIDASNTPVVGSRAVVQFSVSAAANPTASVSPTTHGETPILEADAQQQQATQGGPQDPAAANAAQEPLPAANSLLPLVSVIGFGVLVGGIASAMKTR